MAGIGFFAPLPLAIMIPFMAAQSIMMGEGFGKGYQYAKRKISSMTNEEFNKMDVPQLFSGIVTDYTKIIPDMQKAMQASSDFQKMIVQEIAGIIRSLPKDIVTGFVQAGGAAPGPGGTISMEQIKEALLLSGAGPIGSEIVGMIESLLTSKAEGSPGKSTAGSVFQPHRHTAEHHITKPPPQEKKWKTIYTPAKTKLILSKSNYQNLKNQIEKAKNDLKRATLAYRKLQEEVRALETMIGRTTGRRRAELKGKMVGVIQRKNAQLKIINTLTNIIRQYGANL